MERVGLYRRWSLFTGLRTGRRYPRANIWLQNILQFIKNAVPHTFDLSAVQVSIGSRPSASRGALALKKVVRDMSGEEYICLSLDGPYTQTGICVISQLKCVIKCCHHASCSLHILLG